MPVRSKKIYLLRTIPEKKRKFVTPYEAAKLKL